MPSLRRIALLLAVLSGCARTVPAGGRDPKSAISLRDQAYDLDAEPADPMHHDAVRAMNQLAVALEQLPGDHQTAAGLVRDCAARISHSRPDDLHSDHAKQALTIALQELKRMPRRSRALKPALHEARDAIDQIDETVPYLQQRAEIDRAFNRVATAVMIASLPILRAKR
jgi:hypothetical protein